MTLITTTSFFALALVTGMTGYRFYQVRRGFVRLQDIATGGLTELYLEAHKMYRSLHKKAALYLKLAFQYIFHILVRVLFYVRAGFDTLYVWARNRFMRNAVKSKASVSFFWSHLKEYKSQMEEEREEEKKE